VVPKGKWSCKLGISALGPKLSPSQVKGTHAFNTGGCLNFIGRGLYKKSLYIKAYWMFLDVLEVKVKALSQNWNWFNSHGEKSF